jgi:hypothetical protein
MEGVIGPIPRTHRLPKICRPWDKKLFSALRGYGKPFHEGGVMLLGEASATSPRFTGI